ncbi:MAG: hypothetical protein KW802_04115 [Candidatus Doudnabacteria bacterium]|nr:hypothetical protein [Candidatus Doudnabacteria bacterium]
MTNDEKMEETMNEIFGDAPDGTDLLKDIARLEKEIKTSQQVITDSNEARTSYSTTLSPEASNDRRKNVVFLKKELQKMKDDYEHLDPQK